jgi:hypothetical protein
MDVASWEIPNNTLLASCTCWIHGRGLLEVTEANSCTDVCSTKLAEFVCTIRYLFKLSKSAVGVGYVSPTRVPRIGLTTCGKALVRLGWHLRQFRRWAQIKTGPSVTSVSHLLQFNSKDNRCRDWVKISIFNQSPIHEAHVMYSGLRKMQ